MKEFKATWSTSLHGISWGTTALLVTVAVITAWNSGGQPAEHSALWTVLLILALIPVCALFTVRGYILTQDTLLDLPLQDPAGELGLQLRFQP